MNSGPSFRSDLIKPFPIPLAPGARYLASKKHMGILTKLLFFPIAGPVAGIRWSLAKVQRVVEEELTDDTLVKQDLMELQMKLELGDITDAEYTEKEAVIMARLREIREWRERFGRPSSGGPVRVARDDDAG